MGTRVNFNEASDRYELGDDVDGVFVPFSIRPGSDVRALVQAAREADGSAAEQAAATTAATGASGDAAAKDARIAELETELAASRESQPPAA